MKKLFSLIILLLSFTVTMAQDDAGVEMADVMRSSGKIYVVVSTLVIVFIGLAIYLFSIDRRLKKIENEK
ncbi:CcmD family protein [Mucilaginibacter limnophilus]|uniref:CcmD family protein n=1 Tax=Mucilaginibacter limnophilus TaxID=1932778 RepID=A0A437MYE1_9SPHI|nr:CcmD family protein [Mucilaginibacter limnophilus]RVU02653.1 CcmD family protein [Mucilaginibacter limnophilus]